MSKGLNIDVAVLELLAQQQNPAPTYPEDHKAGMRVPKGGSSCASCEYLADNRTDCTSEHFQKWNGSEVIPAPIDEYCSDWYEHDGDIEAFGTTEGALKGWDTRGRSQHVEHLGVNVAVFDRRKGETDNAVAIKRFLPLQAPEDTVRKQVVEEFKRAKKVGAETISIDNLTPLQHTIFKDKLSAIKKSGFDEPIDVFRYHGVDYVVDGHHRLVRDVMEGKTKVRTVVFELHATLDLDAAIRELLSGGPGSGCNPEVGKCVMDLDFGDERMTEKDLEAYGTSEGAVKGWDTRGRGRKDYNPLGRDETYYRGTTTRTLDRIKKEGGIKQGPEPLATEKESWFGDERLSNTSEKGITFITKREDIAKAYAVGKYHYNEAEPGDEVDFGDFGTYFKPKNGPPAVHGTKPVLLTMSVPKSVVDKMEDDEMSIETAESFKFKGKIPKEYISKVQIYDGHRWTTSGAWKKKIAGAEEEPMVELHFVLNDIKGLEDDEPELDIDAAIEELSATALFRGVEIEGFTGPGEEMIRAALSRVPPELLVNVEKIIAKPGLQPVHGKYLPKEKTIEINPLIFKLRQRFGEGQGWIHHTELALVHEIGHSVYCFLPEKLKDEWRDISGWMLGWKEGQEQPYEEKRPGWTPLTSKWTHKKGIRFPRKYSHKNDDEDFADCFAFMMLNKPHQMAKEKREFMERLIQNQVKRYPQAMIQGPEKAYGEKGN